MGSMCDWKNSNENEGKHDSIELNYIYVLVTVPVPNNYLENLPLLCRSYWNKQNTIKQTLCQVAKSLVFIYFLFFTAQLFKESPHFQSYLSSGLAHQKHLILIAWYRSHVLLLYLDHRYLFYSFTKTQTSWSLLRPVLHKHYST